jgi:uncharacterized membrane protein (Fun14 family)
MKIGKTRQNGFVMVFVIVILALVGIYMIVLTSDANTFLFQADHAYLEACEQNLTASGLAWAKKNIDNTKPPTGAFDLNAAAMNIRGAVISINVFPGKNGASQVQVSTSCSRARQTLTSARKFTIEARLRQPTE